MSVQKAHSYGIDMVMEIINKMFVLNQVEWKMVMASLQQYYYGDNKML